MSKVLDTDFSTTTFRERDVKQNPVILIGVQCPVTARVRKKDKRTRRFVEGIGFKLEGIMRRALKNDDICVYGFLRRDWENSVYG